MMGTDSMSFSGQPKNNLIISSSDTGYKSNGKYYDKFVEIPLSATGDDEHKDIMEQMKECLYRERTHISFVK